MNILFAASEVFPFAKTGGLADFTSSLSTSLRDLGHSVRVITPKYKTTDEHSFQLSPVIEQLEIPISNRFETCSILEGQLEGNIPVYFVKHDPYYHRDHLYGDDQGDYPDNAERFIYFSRGIPDICKALNFSPDILHCHDWQTGLVPVYLQKLYHDDPFFERTATVFTVYNLSHQGLFWHYDMHLTGLGWDLFTPDGLEYYGKINLMKGGLLWSDILTTISPTYSQDIQNKEHGNGLEGVFQYRSDDLYGVVNGIDETNWNPASDPFIPKNYRIRSLSGKKSCKKRLLKEFDLPVDLAKPVLGMVSHFNTQKGANLLAEILAPLMELDLYLILMGTGHEKYHTLFHRIREKHPKKIGLRLEYDTSLEHRILAGSDILLIPSQYEPGGGQQMHSLKYGTMPIVHAASGVDDIVKALDCANQTGTGIVFTTCEAVLFLDAIKKGLQVYHDKPCWKAFQQRAMAEDFSWDCSARAYEVLYRKAREKLSATAISP